MAVIAVLQDTAVTKSGLSACFTLNVKNEKGVRCGRPFYLCLTQLACTRHVLKGGRIDAAQVAGIRIANRRETAAPPTGVRSGKLTFLNFLSAPMSRFLR